MKLKTPLLAIALLTACGGNPQPGEPGYAFNLSGTYDAEFVADDGTAYIGTVTLETLPGGEIGGSMSLSSPMSVVGTVEGLLLGAEATLTIPFEIPDAACGGVVSGSGIVVEGGGEVTGLFDDVSDDCGGAPTSLSFTLTRQAD